MFRIQNLMPSASKKKEPSSVSSLEPVEEEYRPTKKERRSKSPKSPVKTPRGSNRSKSPFSRLFSRDAKQEEGDWRTEDAEFTYRPYSGVSDDLVPLPGKAWFFSYNYVNKDFMFLFLSILNICNIFNYLKKKDYLKIKVDMPL